MPYATASPFLLFRQVVLLCAFAGILTAFAPWPGSAFFLVLCLYNAPRRPRLPLLLLVCGAFALGFGYAQWRTPEEPPLPPSSVRLPRATNSPAQAGPLCLLSLSGLRWQHP